MVFPIVLGAGKRLFPDAGGPTSLELVDSKPVGDGIVTLVYSTASRDSAR
jgi:dihydrofolate reductase